MAKPFANWSKPFVKWAGGKQALADRLISHFPDRFDTYCEPFVGGGSILFRLRPKQAIICDANGWLMDTYIAIREDWRKVARILDTLRNTEREYLRIRKIKLGDLDLFHRAAHMIYLNKTCFRGLFRVNRDGRFNVPFGDYDRRYYDPEVLEQAAVQLRDVQICHGDFELGLANITSRDFTYLDPPYYRLGGYSDFNRYTPLQFRAKDHMRLAAVCRELHDRGVRWALTNSDTPYVRALFRGFRIRTISARREINLDSRKRDISELLITNY